MVKTKKTVNKKEIEIISCPHAPSEWSPCLARDGAMCLSGGDENEARTSGVCVCCGKNPEDLLNSLINTILAKNDRRLTAEIFKAVVAAYVEFSK
jgi:hypothetical protein